MIPSWVIVFLGIVVLGMVILIVWAIGQNEPAKKQSSGQQGPFGSSLGTRSAKVPPEEKRKEIFAEHKTSHSSLIDEANARLRKLGDAPVDSLGSLKQQMVAIGLAAKVAGDALEAKIAKKHGLTKDMLLAIIKEGENEKWPFPGSSGPAHTMVFPR